MRPPRMWATALCVGIVFAASAAFALQITSAPNAAIADNAGDTTPVLDAIDTTPFFTTERVISVYVELRIAHTWVGDLAIELISPSGTELQLFARPGDTHPDETLGSPYGYNTDLRRNRPITFIDSATMSGELLGSIASGNGRIPAGSYFPDADGWVTDITSFAGFAGELAAGDWTLRVGDYAVADTGRLVEWSIFLDAPEPDAGLMLAVGLLGLIQAGRPRERRRIQPGSIQPGSELTN